MFISNRYKLDLLPTTCITPDGSKSISTIVPSVTERVLQHFCRESAQGPHLVPFLSSFSGYIHDRETYLDLSRSQKNKILGEMRQSLAEILQHLEVVIGPDAEGMVACTDNHDHTTTPRITLRLTGYVFEALSQVRTEAEVDHALLLLVTTIIDEIGHVWLRVRHPSIFTSEKVNCKSGASGQEDGGELKEVALFGGLLNLVEIKVTTATREITTRRLSIDFPSTLPASTYIIKDQSVRRILTMFLVQDEMLDSPPFFTALRDVFRLYSAECRDMVQQSTTMPSTASFPRLPTLRQHASSSNPVVMAENKLVSGRSGSDLTASHSGLPGWRSFKDGFFVSFATEPSSHTQSPPHTSRRTKSSFHTAGSKSPPKMSLGQAPLPFPQARLNERGEVEYYPFTEV